MITSARDARLFALDWGIRYWQGQLKLATDAAGRARAWREIAKLQQRIQDLLAAEG
jgi:hypothetical protein